MFDRLRHGKRGALPLPCPYFVFERGKTRWSEVFDVAPATFNGLVGSGEMEERINERRCKVRNLEMRRLRDRSEPKRTCDSFDTGGGTQHCTQPLERWGSTRRCTKLRRCIRYDGEKVRASISSSRVDFAEPLYRRQQGTLRS
jgi:hypothetical protein